MVVSSASEKYDFVSWDDDIPNIWKVTKVMFQTTKQWMYLFSSIDILEINHHFFFRIIVVIF